MKNKKGVWLYALLLLCIYMQHRYMFMYFDDYGYASLTYGSSDYYNSGNVTIEGILGFLRYSYFNWGGRILVYFAEIITLQGGISAMRIIQSIIISGILVLSIILLKNEQSLPNEKVQLSLLVIFSYLLMGRTTYTDGIFWFSASVAYVWPYFFLLMGIFVEREFHNRGWQKLISAVCFFIAAFSQEQTAVLVMAYSIFSFALSFKALEGRRRYIATVILPSFIGGLLCILAPGNFARASSDLYAEFNSMNFIEKIFYNIPSLIDINIGKDNILKGLLLFCISLLLTVSAYKCRRIKSLILFGFLIINGFELSTYFAEYSTMMTDAIRILWVVLFTLQVSDCLLWEKNRMAMLVLALFWSGLLSQGMMLLTPSISTRTHLPLEWVLNIVVAYIFSYLIKTKTGIKNIIILVTGVAGILNAFNIWNGYRQNAEVNEINHYKLIEKSEQIAGGADVGTIILYRLPDDRYANVMPYQQSFMETWLKYYYKIPQETTLCFVDLEDNALVYERVYSETPVIASCWPDIINSECTFHEDGSIDISITPAVISPYLIAVVNGMDMETVVDDQWISLNVPAELLAGDYIELQVKDTMTGNVSDIFKMPVNMPYDGFVKY